MATYSTKYNLCVESVEGRIFDVLLKKRSYSGPLYQVKGSGNPVSIQAPTRKRKFTSIAGTELRLNLVHQPTETNFNLLTDFEDILDREWQAELREQVIGEVYKASGKIQTLTLNNQSTPATARVVINGIAPVGALTVKCAHTFNKTTYEVQSPVPEPFTTYVLYAKPANSTIYDPSSWKTISAAEEMPFLATTEEIIDTWILETPEITKTSPNSIEYNGFSFNGEIDSSYQLWVEVEDQTNYRITGQSTNERFESTANPFINIIWNTRNLAGSTATPVILATKEPEFGDTTLSVANELRDQINGAQGYTFLENIRFEDGVYRDFRITASVEVAATVDLVLTLLDLGAVGNSVELLRGDTNKSYLQIKTDPFSDYDLTFPSIFGGGADGGDTFTFQTSIGNVSVIAQTGDTAESIISRLVDEINVTLSEATAEVDGADLTRFNVFVNLDLSAGTYSFITDGASILVDDGPSWIAQNSFLTKWIGFVAPGMNQQQHLPDNTVLSLSALCGLGDLKNFEFTYNDRRPFEKLPLITIISQVLSNTGLDLRIYEAFDLFETSMDFTGRPLEQAYEDTLRLNGESAYVVLQGVLPLIKVYIMQVDGHWELRPMDQLKNNAINYRVYSATGRYISTVVEDSHKINIGSCTPNPFIGASAIKQKKAPFRQLITEQNFGFVNQLLRFPNFSNLNDNLNELNYNPQYPWLWTYEGIAYTSYLSKVVLENDGFIRISSSSNQANKFELLQRLVIGEVDETYDPTQRDFQLEVEYEIQETGDSVASSSMDFMLKFIDGANELFLFEEDPDNPVENPVTVTETYITVTTKEEEKSKKIFKQSFNFPFDNISRLADAEIRIRQSSTGYFRVKSVKIIVNAVVASFENIAEYFTDADSEGVQWKDRVSSTIEKVPLILGDVPNIPGGAQIYKNALFTYNNDIELTTRLWSADPLGPTPAYLPLVQLVRREWMNEYAVPYNKLRATVRGSVELKHVLIDKTDGDLMYMLMGGIWNIKMNTVQGEWEQINLQNDIPNFPVQRVLEVLPVTKESAGTNSFTGGSGGGQTGTTPGIGDIEFPVTSVNSQTGAIELDADSIPDATTSNKFVNATGQTIAQTGGRIINPVSTWDGGLRNINHSKEKFERLNISNGVSSIALNLLFGVDSPSFSRDNIVLLNNKSNNTEITTLDFRTTNGNWVWENGSPPVSIPGNTRWVLYTTNINNQAVLARMVQVTGALENAGIGYMIIEDTFIVG